MNENFYFGKINVHFSSKDFYESLRETQKYIQLETSGISDLLKFMTIKNYENSLKKKLQNNHVLLKKYYAKQALLRFKLNQSDDQISNINEACPEFELHYTKIIDSKVTLDQIQISINLYKLHRRMPKFFKKLKEITEITNQFSNKKTFRDFFVFSTIPSYFSFFQKQSQNEIFLNSFIQKMLLECNKNKSDKVKHYFLERMLEKICRCIFIIPSFIEFLHVSLCDLFSSYIREEEPFIDDQIFFQRVFQNIIQNLQNNVNLCPIFIKQFLGIFENCLHVDLNCKKNKCDDICKKTHKDENRSNNEVCDDNEILELRKSIIKKSFLNQLFKQPERFWCCDFSARYEYRENFNSFFGGLKNCLFQISDQNLLDQFIIVLKQGKRNDIIDLFLNSLSIDSKDPQKKGISNSNDSYLNYIVIDSIDIYIQNIIFNRFNDEFSKNEIRLFLAVLNSQKEGIQAKSVPIKSPSLFDIQEDKKEIIFMQILRTLIKNAPILKPNINITNDKKFENIIKEYLLNQNDPFSIGKNMVLFIQLKKLFLEKQLGEIPADLNELSTFFKKMKSFHDEAYSSYLMSIEFKNILDQINQVNIYVIKNFLKCFNFIRMRNNFINDKNQGKNKVVSCVTYSWFKNIQENLKYVWEMNNEYKNFIDIDDDEKKYIFKFYSNSNDENNSRSTSSSKLVLNNNNVPNSSLNSDSKNNLSTNESNPNANYFKIEMILHLQKISFYDFLSSRPDLNITDSYIRDFIFSRQNDIINFIVNKDSNKLLQKFLEEKRKKDDIFEHKIFLLIRTFNANVNPIAKYEMIKDCWNDLKSRVNEKIDRTGLFNLIFTNINPPKFISNFVYLYEFYEFMPEKDLFKHAFSFCNMLENEFSELKNNIHLKFDPRHYTKSLHKEVYMVFGKDKHTKLSLFEKIGVKKYEENHNDHKIINILLDIEDTLFDIIIDKFKSKHIRKREKIDYHKNPHFVVFVQNDELGEKLCNTFFKNLILTKNAHPTKIVITKNLNIKKVNENDIQEITENDFIEKVKVMVKDIYQIK